MSIEERVLKLERENRSLKATALGLAIAGVVWLAVTTVLGIVGVMTPEKDATVAKSPETATPILAAEAAAIGTLRVERLEVGDTGDGQTNFGPLLVIDDAGSGIQIVMRDRDGTASLTMSVQREAANVAIKSSEFNASITDSTLTLARIGDGPRIPLTGVELSVSDKSGGSVNVGNRYGRPVALLRSDGTSSGSILLRDVSGAVRRRIDVE